jgi:Tol biopolymer transport system component
VWSPDGREIAFASDEGGKPRVWVVNADGASPRALKTRDLSESFELAWSPGDRVIYQQADNRNYSVVDPRTERQATLVKDGSVGWMSSPVPSPDGMKVAVAWNRYPARGIYVISADGSEVPIHQPPQKSDSDPFPIGWSSDGRFIYAVDGKRAAYRGVTAPFEETLTGVRILKLPVNGGRPDTIMTVPFEEVGSITVFPDGLKFVCAVYSSRSDVWVVENFDPSSRTVLARR